MANKSHAPNQVAFLAQRVQELLDALPPTPPTRPVIQGDRVAFDQLAAAILERIEAVGVQLWAMDLGGLIRERVPRETNRALLPNSPQNAATYLIRLAVDIAEWKACRVNWIGYSEEEIDKLASSSVDWHAHSRECIFNILYGDQQHLDDFENALCGVVSDLVPQLAKRIPAKNPDHTVSLDFVDVAEEVRKTQKYIREVITSELPRLEAHAHAGDRARFKDTLDFHLASVWKMMEFLADRFRSGGQVAPLPEMGNPLSRIEAEGLLEQALAWLDVESARFLPTNVGPSLIDDAKRDIPTDPPPAASTQEPAKISASEVVARAYEVSAIETVEQLLIYLERDARFSLTAWFHNYWRHFNLQNPSKRKHSRDFDSAEPQECPLPLMELYECMSRLRIPAHRPPPFNVLRFNAISARVELANIQRQVEEHDLRMKSPNPGIKAPETAPPMESGVSQVIVDQKRPQSHSAAYTNLLGFAREELVGKQRKLIETLCSSDGSRPIADLAVILDWERPWDEPFNSIRKAVNKKLRKSKSPFVISRKDNIARFCPTITGLDTSDAGQK